MYKPSFFTFRFNSLRLALALALALIIGVIALSNSSLATAAPTQSFSNWLFGKSAASTSSGVVKACADDTRGDAVTVADCIARQSKQLLRNSTLSLGENLVETSGSALLGDNFKLKSKLSWNDNSGVQGELDVVVPVWGEAQTKSLFLQPGVAIWRQLGGQKKRTDANLGLVYRSLNSSGDALFGSSIFYDRNLDYDHQRLGLGFDVQTQLGYASFNYYHPLSNDWRQGRSGFEERALRGYDFRLEKLFYQGRVDVEANLGAWRRNQPGKWVYTYGVDFSYKVNNYLSLSLGYEDFSGQPLSALPSNRRWQIGLKLDLMKLYTPKTAQHAGSQGPLDLWRTVSREKRILYQERVANTILEFRVTSITQLTPVPAGIGITNAEEVSWLVSFSKPVKNVDISDFVLTAGGSSNGATASSAPVQSNGSVIQNALHAGDSSNGATINRVELRNNDTEVEVFADSSNIEGTLRLSFSPTNNITDKDDTSVNATPVNTTPSGANQHTYTLDHLPTVVISGVADEVDRAQFTATFTFSEAVPGFGIDDIAVTNATLANFRRVSATVYTVDVTPTANGALSLTIAKGAVRDTNANLTPPPPEEDTTSTVTAVPPTVVSIERSSPTNEHTNADSVTWLITFSEAVSNAVASDFSLTGTDATLMTRKVTDKKFEVTAHGGNLATLDAEITLIFADNQNIQDLAGTALSTTGTALSTPPTGANETSYTIDNTAPKVLSITGIADEVTTILLPVTITFDEAVTGFAQRNIDATNATLSSFRRDSGAVYRLDMNPTAEGLLILSIPKGAARDAAGNESEEFMVTSNAVFFSIGFDSANYHVVAGETLTLTVTANRALKVGESVNIGWTPLTVGTADTDDDITLPEKRGNNRKVIIGATESSGTITITTNANTTGEGDEYFVISLTPPRNTSYDILRNTTTVTILGNDADVEPTVVSIQRKTPLEARTNADSVTWSITFNEAVENVDINDFILTGTTASLMVDLNGKELDVTASGGDLADLNAPITLSFASAPGQNIQDTMGNPLANTTPSGSNYNQHTYIIDNTAPTVAISGVPAKVGAPFTATITFSEGVTGFEQSHIVATNATLGTLRGFGAVYTVEVTPTGNGDLSLSIAANLVEDTVGNANTAAPPITRSVDVTAPTVLSIERATLTNGQPNKLTNADRVTWRITFSEAVKEASISASDFRLSGATGVTLTPVLNGRVLDVTASGGDLAGLSTDVTLSFVASPAIEDLAGNPLPTTILSDINSDTSYRIDTIAPKVVISDVPREIGLARFTATITFSEAVSGFEKSDIDVSSNATLGTFSGSDAVYMVEVTPVANGNLSLSIAAGAAQDSAGNLSGAAIPATTTVGPISIGFEFAHYRAVPGEAATLTIKASRPLSEDVDVLWSAQQRTARLGSGEDYTVPTGRTVTLPAGETIATFTIPTVANTKEEEEEYFEAIIRGLTPADAAQISTATARTRVTIEAPDTFAPEVVSIKRSSPTDARTNLDEVSWLVTFNEEVQNPDATDLNLNFSLNGTTATLAAEVMSATELKVTASSGDLAGLNAEITLSFAASPTIQDLAGNALSENTAPTSGTNENSYTIDNTAPTVVSIARTTLTSGEPNKLTNADSLVWRITFDAAVKNVGVNDFSLSGATDATLRFALDGKVLDVTASDGDLAGLNTEVTLSFVASPTIDDLAGNRLTNITLTGATNENSYTLDNMPPTALILGVAKGNLSAFSTAINFSEEVTGFEKRNIITTNATLGAFSGTNARYKVDVTPTAAGALTLFIGVGAAKDLAGNLSVANTTTIIAGPITVGFELDNYRVVPGETVSLTINTSRPLTEASDLRLRLKLSLLGAENDTATGSDYTLPADVFMATGESTATFDIVAAANTADEVEEYFHVDLELRSNDTLVQLNTATTTTRVTIEAPDVFGPRVVSIARSAPTDLTTNANELTWRITFDEALKGSSISASDFSLSGATDVTFTPVLNGRVLDVTASGGNLAGLSTDVTLSFVASPAIEDLAGNRLTNITLTGTTNENSYTLDNTPPEVLSITVTEVSTGLFRATITFSEAVTGFTQSGINEVNATLGNFIGSDGATVYTVDVTPTATATATNPVSLSINAGAANDLLGHPSVVSTATSFDPTALRVLSITRQTPTDERTNVESVTWRVTFSKAVRNVDVSDFNLGGTNAPLTVVPVPSDNNKVFDVTASGGDLVGLDAEITLSIDDDQDIENAVDATELLTNIVPSGTDNSSYTIDNTVPTVVSIARTTLTSGEPNKLTNADSLVWRITFDAAVKNVGVNDFSLSGATDATLRFDLDGKVLDVTASDGDLAGLNTEVTLSFVASPTIDDLAGNRLTNITPPSGGKNEPSYTLDNMPPTALILGVAKGNLSAFSTAINFSEDVTGFEKRNIITTNATLGAISGRNARYKVDVTPTAAGALTLFIGVGAAKDLAGNLSVANTTTIIAGPITVGFELDNYRVVPGETVSLTINTSRPLTEASDLRLRLKLSLLGAENDTATGSDYTLPADVFMATGESTATFDIVAAANTADEVEEYFHVDLELRSNDTLVQLNTATTTTRVTIEAPDVFGPRVVSIARSAPTDLTTNANELTWRITFDEALKGSSISASDFSLSGATDVTFTPVLNGRVLDVTASGGDLAGLSTDVTLSFVASPAIEDLAGNRLTDITLTGTTNENRYTLDNTPPEVRSITVTEVSTGLFRATITFSEAVTGFTQSGINEVNATLGNFIGADGATVYTVDVTPTATATATNPVSLSINAGAANDLLGHPSVVSTATSFDPTALRVLSITRQTPTTERTNVESVTWRVTFSKAVRNVDVSDFSLGGTNAPLTVVPDANNKVFDVTASGGDLVGLNAEITLSIDDDNQDIENAVDATELLTNIDPSGTDNSSYTIDNTVPTVVSIARTTLTSGEPNKLTNADSLVWRITFDAAVKNVGVNDFSLSGATDATLRFDLDGKVLDVTASDGDLAGLNTEVTLSFVASPTIDDLAGNRLTNITPPSGGKNEPSYTLDNMPPTALILGVAKGNLSAFSTAINFSEEVTGFEKRNIITTNATLGAISGRNARYKVDVTPTAAGALTLFIGVGAAKDLAGNLSVANTTTIIAGPITVGFELDNYRVVPGETVSLTINTSRPLTEASDLRLRLKLSLLGAENDTATGSDYTLPADVFMATGESTATFDIVAAANTADEVEEYFHVDLELRSNDTLVQLNTATTTTRVTIAAVDVFAPRVVSIARSEPTDATTNANELTWRITFDEALKGSSISASDFSLSGATDVTLTPVLNGSVLDVTARGGNLADLNTDVTLSFVASPAIEDLAGNRLTDITLTGTSNDNSYTLDNDAPRVNSIVRFEPSESPTNADNLVWVITFSEPVKASSISASDFDLTLTGEASGATAILDTEPVNTTGNKYRILADISALNNYDGSITFTFAPDQNIQDAVGNPLTTPSTISNNSYTIDKTAPTVTSIERLFPTDKNTNADNLIWEVTFSEEVENVDASNFSLGDVEANIVIDGDGSDRVYYVDVSGDNIAGLNAEITLSFVASPTIQDLAGNLLTNTTPTTSGPDANQNSYILDNAPPTVVSIARTTLTSGEPNKRTNADELTWRITFDEAVKNVGVNDFSLSGATDVTLTPVLDGKVLDVTASDGNLAGLNADVTLSFVANPTIDDLAGNPLTPTIPTGANNSYTLDNTGPVVRSGTVSEIGSTGVFENTITFNEEVIGFTQSDIKTVNATLTSFLRVSGTVYTVNVTPASSGLPSLSIDAGDIEDSLGNPNIAITAGSLNFTAPSVVSITRETTASSNGRTNATEVSWRVTFSKPVKNLVSDNFVVTAGDGSSITTVVSEAEGMEAVVSATNNNNEGAFRLSIKTPNTIADKEDDTPLSGTIPTSSTNEHYIIDRTGPKVFSIARSSPTAATTNENELTWLITFDEAVKNASADNFSLRFIMNGTIVNNITHSLAVTAVPESGGTQLEITASGDGLADFTGTITLGFASSILSIRDLADNRLSEDTTPTSGTSEPTFTLDNAPPSVVISGVEIPTQIGSKTHISEVTITARFTFSEPVFTFDESDIEITPTSSRTVANFLRVSDSVYTIEVTPTVPGGQLTFSIAASAARDALGHESEAVSLTRTINFRPKLLAIDRQFPTTDPIVNANAANLFWRITFDERVRGATEKQFNLDVDGSNIEVAIGIRQVSRERKGWILTVPTATIPDGLVTFSIINPEKIFDAEGNGNTLANTTPIGDNHNTFTLDRTPPTVTSIARSESATDATTNADSLDWFITFSEAVKNIDADDFILNGVGVDGTTIIPITTAILSIQGPDPITGYQITADISALSYTGPIMLNVKPAPGIQDIAGNALTNITPTTTNDNSYTVDKTAPTVTSIQRHSPTALNTNSNSLVWRVTFSEPLKSLPAFNFILSSDSSTRISISSINRSNPITSYLLTTDISALGNYTGPVTLNFQSVVNIQDRAGNQITDTTPTNRDPDANENTYNIDQTRPSVVISGVDLYIGASKFTARINFSEAVTEFDVSNIESNATLSGFDAVSGSGGIIYKVDVTPITAGELYLEIPDSAARDEAGNYSTASERVMSNVDLGPPTVLSIRRETLTNGAPNRLTSDDVLEWRITFSKKVMNVDAGDFTLTGTGTSGSPGSPTSVQLSRDSTYLIQANHSDLVDYNGDVTLDFSDNQDIADLAGTPLTDTSRPEDADENSYTLVNNDPTVTITGVEPNIGEGEFIATFTFSIAVRGFEKSDITPTNATLGLFRADPSTTVSVSGVDYSTTYTVVVTPTASGALSLSIDDGAARDEAANLSLAATIEGTADLGPKVVSIERVTLANEPANQRTNADILVWRITFSKTVQALEPNYFNLTYDPDFTTSWSILSGMDSKMDTVWFIQADNRNLENHNGSITLNISVRHDIRDLAGNPLTNTTPTSTLNEDSYTLDNEAPRVTSIERLFPTDKNTNSDNLIWSVTFSEEVENVDASNFSLGDVTANIVIDGAGSGRVYYVDVSGGNIAGLNAEITLSFVASPTIQDLTGNLLTDTTPATSGPDANQNSYTLDNSAPTITITGVEDGDTIGAGMFLMTITFSEVVSGFTQSDITIMPGTAVRLSDFEAVSGTTVAGVVSASTYTVNVTPQENGELTLSIMDGAGRDAANNTSAVFGPITITADIDAPTVTSIKRITPTNGSGTQQLQERTAVDVVEWRVIFNEAVEVDADDFVLTLTGDTTTSHRITGSGTTYMIHSNNGDINNYNGPITLTFKPGYSIQDAASNPLTNTTPTDSTKNQHSYTLDNTPPTVTITGFGPTINGKVAVMLAFSEEIYNFDESDIQITPPANRTLSGFMKVPDAVIPGSVYKIDVTPTENGTLTLTLDSSAGRDEAGNSTPITTRTATVVLSAAPTVSSIERNRDVTPSSADGTTNSNSVAWTITFNKDVQNVNENDVFIAELEGQANITVLAANIQRVTHAVYWVEPQIPESLRDIYDGLVTLKFHPDQNIQNLDGVPLTDTAFPTGANNNSSYTLDNTAPTVSSVTGIGSEISGEVTVTITFSEEVFTFDESDIKITPANKRTLSGYTKVSGSEYRIDVTPTAQGTLTLTLDSSAGHDAASNPTPLTTRTSNVNLPPRAVSIKRQSPTAATTNANRVTWRVTFSEPVNAVGRASFTVNGTLLPGDRRSHRHVSQRKVHEFTASGYTGHNGPIKFGFTGGNNITDDTGKRLDTTPPSDSENNQHTYNLDQIPPRVESISGVTNKTTLDPFTVTITFNEAVSGFGNEEGDIVLVNATRGAVSGSDTVYTVVVTPTSDGLLTLTIPQGAAADAAGNGNTTNRAESMIDIALRVVSIERHGTIVSADGTTKSNSLAWLITFSEAVTGAVAASFNVLNPDGNVFRMTGRRSLAHVIVSENKEWIYTANIPSDYNGTLKLGFVSFQIENIMDMAGISLTPANTTPPSGNPNERTYTVDNDPRVVSINGVTNKTNLDPFTVTITFNEAVSGFGDDVGDITASNATLGTVSGSGTVYTVEVTPTGDGELTLTIAEGAATDATGNRSIAITETSTIDTTAPRVVSISGVTNKNTLDPFTVTITFSEPVSGFGNEEGDIVLVNATRGAVTGSGSVYTVEVTPTGDGELTLTIAEGAATDAAGNRNPADPANTETSMIDTTPPTVVSIKRHAPQIDDDTATTRARIPGAFSVTWRVTFSEAVKNADAIGDFILSSTSTAERPILTTTTLSDAPSGGGTVLDITASGGNITSHNGTFTLSFNPEHNILDLADNELADNPIPSGSGNNQHTYNIDHRSPDVSISNVPSEISTEDPFTVTITFDEPVTEFEETEITVFNATLSDLMPADPPDTTPGSVYTVLVTPASEGDVRLSIRAAVAIDAAGNGNAASQGITITRLVIDPLTVSYDPLNYSVVAGQTATLTIRSSRAFDERTEFRYSTVNGTALGGPDYVSPNTAKAFIEIGGTSTTFDIMTVPTEPGEETKQFTIRLRQKISGGFKIWESATVTITPTPSPAAAPTVVSIERRTLTNGSYQEDTAADSLIWHVTFNKAVQNANEDDFRVSSTTPELGSVSLGSALDDSGRVLTLIAGGGNLAGFNGPVTLSFADGSDGAAAQDIEDAAANGNRLTNTTPTDSTKNEHTYNLDNDPPRVVSTSSFTDKTNLDPFTFAITFNERVTDFGDEGGDDGDVTVSSNATLTTVSGAGGAAYTAVVDPTGDGELTLTITEGAATDAAGNRSIEYTKTITIDTSAAAAPPTVVSFERKTTASSNGTTNANEVVWDVIFSKPVKNVVLRSFSVPTDRGGRITRVGIDRTGLKATIRAISSNGDAFRLSISSTNTIADKENSTPLSGTSPPDGNTDEHSYIIDKEAPEVTSIARGESATDATTNADSLVWFITFDETVKNVDADDFVLNGVDVDGTTIIPITTAILSIQGPDPITGYQITADISAVIYTGPITLNVMPTPGIQDIAGNALTSITPPSDDANDNSYTVDKTPPSVVISGVENQTDLDPFTVTITFSEAVNGFGDEEGDITVSSNATRGTVSGSGTVYTVEVTPTAEGTLSLTIAEGAATDAVGNPSLAMTETSTIGTVALRVDSIERRTLTNGNYQEDTAADSLIWRVTFNKAVQNVSATDFSVEGATASLESALDDSGRVLTLTASGGNLASFNGPVRLSFADGQEIRDAAGIRLTTANTIPPIDNINEPSYTLDDIPPRLASIKRTTLTTGVFGREVEEYTPEDILIWRVIFDEALDTVDENDFSLTLTDEAGTTTTTAHSISGSGTTYMIQSTNSDPHEHNGPIQLNFTDGHTIQDAAGNPLANPLLTTDSVPSDNLTGDDERRYILDNIPPTVLSINGVGPNSDGSNFTATFTFSETVTGFMRNDIMPNNVTLTPGTFTRVSGSVYTVEVEPAPHGDLSLTILEGAGRDLAGNKTPEAVLASTIASGGPTVLSFLRQGPRTEDTSSNTLKWRVTFSEAVENANQSTNFNLFNSDGGIITAPLSSGPLGGGGDRWVVTVTSTNIPNGSVRLGFPANNTIVNTAGAALDLTPPIGANNNQHFIIEGRQ